MPKISAEQWKAQEQRYLDAARRCFTRIGVAPASMEEIRAEAGVSAGAMYRYFLSKDDLVHAAIETSMDELEGVLGLVGQSDALTIEGSPHAYLLALLNALRQFRYHTEGVDLFRLAVQGWAHAQTQPRTRALVIAAFDRQRAAFTKVVGRWTTRTDAPGTAAAVGGAVIGYIVQSAFSDDDIDPEQYCEGLTRLR